MRVLLSLVVLSLLLAQAARGGGGRLGVERLAFWDRIAACETGSNWQMSGSTYEGGVGFYVGTWRWWARELGYLARYPHAYLAPRMVQIAVADYGLRVHSGYWGCNR